MKRYYFLLIPLFAVLYSSCTKVSEDGPTPDPLQGLLLTDTLTMYTGNVVKLNVTVTPTSYDTTKLVWKSSDTAVISVTNSGVIKAKNEGTSQISLSNVAQTKSVSCLVTVKDSLKVGLIAYYPFDNSANDASGNGNNGEGNNLTAVANRFGVANSAFYFNGINSFVQVKDKPVLRLANTDFTISEWIKLDDYNASFGSQLLVKRLPGESQGWSVSITGHEYFNSGQGNIGLLAFYEGSSNYSTLGTNVINVGSWHMITTAYSYGTHTMKLYVDGNLDKSFSGYPSPNSSIASDMFIGKDNPEVFSDGYFVKGAMDDIRFYSRTLNANDVKKLFNATH